jgi:hypothetical protein
MKWTLLAASTAIAATLWMPGDAAQAAASAAATAHPAAPAVATAGADNPITFEEYRDWRLNFIERRQSDLARQLAVSDLPAPQKARLEQAKAYYDWLAGLSDSDRDRRFRERFDRIDANHDGQIDQTELAAWRDKQRAFYHRDGGARQPVEAASH